MAEQKASPSFDLGKVLRSEMDRDHVVQPGPEKCSATKKAFSTLQRPDSCLKTDLHSSLSIAWNIILARLEGSGSFDS